MAIASALTITLGSGDSTVKETASVYEDMLRPEREMEKG